MADPRQSSRLGRRALGACARASLVVLGLELLAGFAAHLWPAAPDRDARVTAAVFAGVPWAEDYFQELGAAAQARWEPYSYWRRRAFAGEFIHVNAEGERSTLNPPELSEGAPEIWCFGGSTLWGTGARDEGTIPSRLSALLNQDSARFRVRNFGEAGYVSTQERFACWTRLQSGARPTAIVFYDGANDQLSAFQQARAGLPLQEGYRALDFNRRPGVWPLWLYSEDERAFQPAGAVDRWRDLFQRTATAHWLGRIGVLSDPRGRLAPNHALELGREPSSDPVALATECAQRFAANLALGRSLAQYAGCVHLSCWQPTVYHKLVDSGEAEMARAFPGQAEFFRGTTALLGQQPGLLESPDFLELSALFSDQAEPLFFDWCHVGEAANQRIAAAIAAALEARL